MKPKIFYRVPARREAMEKAFGFKLGGRCIPNPGIDEYSVVLRFAGTKVLVSGELSRALRKIANTQGPILLIVSDLTVEARQIAIDAKCDVISLRDFFGWTDARYQRIRQNISD